MTAEGGFLDINGEKINSIDIYYVNNPINVINLHK